jgi:glycosyltransferase involved in cell wall biosynthesis
MHIWYLSAHDQPKGQSARTYDFARELLKRGHHVTMFTNSYNHFTHEEFLGEDEKWRIEEIDGIRVVWLRTIHYKGNGLRRGLNMVSNAWRALAAARTLPDRPDVVVGPSVPLLTGWAALRLAKRYGAAFVFEVRDVWPAVLVDDGGLSKNSPVYHAFRAIEKQLYRQSQRISTVLPFVAPHVAASGGRAEIVTWVPNGVDFQRFAGADAYDGGGDRPLVVMYVGGYSPEHDVMTIVRAAAIVEARRPGAFRFVLVGGGIKRRECEEAAARAGGTIEFRDFVPKHEVPRLQRESDILVACLINTKAFRFGLNLNKMFDYLASGRPVVFSGDAPNDPVRESGAGFTVPPEDPEAMAAALERLAGMSPAERQALGRKGRRYVEENYDMRVLGDRMDDLLRQAVTDKRGVV